jgi:hypothetical protein
MTFLQSTLSGLAYFGLYAIGFYLFHFGRSRKLEHRLRQMIQPKQVDANEERAHLVIRNGTRVDITIRGVCLVGENDDTVRLDYVGDTGDFMNDLDTVEHRNQVSYALHVGKKTGLQERNFVHLPQQTGGLWLLKTEQIRSNRYTFKERQECLGSVWAGRPNPCLFPASCGGKHRRAANAPLGRARI